MTYESVHTGQLAAGQVKKRPAAAPNAESSTLVNTEQTPTPANEATPDADLAALREIAEFEVDKYLIDGKKSCTILFGATGQCTSVKKECLFNVCVNFTKRSFYIYGGTEAAGNAPSKRNHSWSKTSPSAAWQDAYAVMSEHFHTCLTPPTKKQKGNK